jgi:hypothetical protein
MKSCVIIIPPLGTDPKMGEKMTQNWLEKYAIKPINWQYFWGKNDDNYETRLKKLIGEIDKLNEQGFVVSLIGLSAGGSVAINAFLQRKKQIKKVINICGRLYAGKIKFPKSEKSNDNNFLFKESVKKCEENLKSLNVDDKEKILTVRPLWDEFAPTEYAMIEGVKNIKVFSVEHVLTILLSMTIYKNKIFDFLKK